MFILHIEEKNSRTLKIMSVMASRIRVTTFLLADTKATFLHMITWQYAIKEVVITVHYSDFIINNILVRQFCRPEMQVRTSFQAKAKLIVMHIALVCIPQVTNEFWIQCLQCIQQQDFKSYKTQMYNLWYIYYLFSFH